MASDNSWTVERELAAKSSAAVLRVRLQDKTSAVLKLERRRGEATRELDALGAFASSGRVPAGRPVASGALLVDFVRGRELSAPYDLSDDLLEALGGALAQLHVTAPVVGFMPLTESVKRNDAGIRHGRRLSQRAREASRRALITIAEGPTPTPKLLHGDLHPANVFLDEGAIAFLDPYGLIGDPAYDVAFLAGYARKEPRRALKFLVEGYGQPLAQAQQWLVWTVAYRLDNAIRNGLPISSHFSRVIEELTA